MSHDYYCDGTDLDEFLVEYVDGTMDPVVRGAFEEFLRVYPEVRTQVDHLISVRSELCKLGDDCRCQAPPGFQDRLKRQLACEMSGTVELEHWTPQLNMIAIAFSITILMLAVGLSRVVTDEALTAEATTPPATVLVESPAVAFEVLDEADEASSGISHAHQLSMASSFAAAFDRPVLMSVRRDSIAMKPVAMPLAP